MAIIQLSSNNPNFSFIIRKNPASGMMLRTIRQGTAFGWFSEDQRYNVYFKDAENEISYKQTKEESFEYLNVSRYNTPLFPLGAISEFFTSPLKGRHEADGTGYSNVFYVTMVHVESVTYIDYFRKHFTDYEIEMKHLAHKSYSITINTRKSIHDLLNISNLLFLFLSLSGKECIDITENLVAKYLQTIHVLDAPFYIRYLFTRNLLINKKLFYKFKHEVESTDQYEISFAFGNTAQQRRSAIEQCLSFDKPIVDIGCGEGFYTLPFAKKLEEKAYYAIDRNEEIIERLNGKLEKKELDHVYTYLSFDEFLDDYNGEMVDVILTEVIEHMSKEEAEALIRAVCEKMKFHTFIITTPNRDFNKYYLLEESRHIDHQWEMTEKEFKGWINQIFEDYTVSMEHVGFGDRVNDSYTTQGVIVTSRRGD